MNSAHTLSQCGYEECLQRDSVFIPAGTQFRGQFCTTPIPLSRSPGFDSRRGDQPSCGSSWFIPQLIQITVDLEGDGYIATLIHTLDTT
jgi:hypothetical protein